MNKKMALLNELKSGRVISGYYCLDKWFLVDYRKYISDFIKAGYVIHSRWQTNHDGHRYKVYWMDVTEEEKQNARAKAQANR